MAKLKASKGTIRCSVTPRHDLANMDDYGQTAEYIFDLYEDANNYLRLRREPGLLRLAYNAQGAGEQAGAWNGGWAADEGADIKVKYGGSGAVLTVNGIERLTVPGAVEFASEPSQPIRWLNRQDGTLQFDGTIQEWQGLADGSEWWTGGAATIGAPCIWAAYQPKGAASLAASYTDVSGNGNNAGVGVAPTWDGVNGWKFNGVNQYLTTTFQCQNDQSQSVIVQFTTVTNNGIVTGVRENGDWLFIQPDSGAAQVSYKHGSVTVAVGPALAAGNLAIAGNQGYRNGAADGGALVGYTTATTRNLAIGGAMRVTIQNPCAVYIQVYAIHDCTLAATQVANIATAMAAI